METQPLYRQLARHYRQAIESGVLAPGDRMPSVRAITRQHSVSLSTALQACRHLEDEGLLQARERSGYFVRQVRRAAMAPAREPDAVRVLDAAQFVGIHDRVSDYVAKCEMYPAQVNLAIAYAPPDAYPAQPLRQAATRILRARPELLTSPVPLQGDPSLRATLARRALAAGMQLGADDIVITHGCIEALNVALRAVARPGDTVAVESPTYYGLLQVLESLGLRALEIPTSPLHGISVDALELALHTHPDIRAVAVVPNFQNPLGAVMPDNAKAQLVALCERHGVPLIEDDTYGALSDVDTTLKALKAWDTTGNVIHCASLHKVLAPGLRLGWIAGGRWHARVKMLKYAQSRPNEALSQLAAAEVLGSATYDRHLVRLRRQLRTQREQMAEALAAHFPAGTRLSMPAGGVLLWVELSQFRDGQAVFDAALPRGIRVSPGGMFSNSRRFDHFLRISCGSPFTSRTEQAVRELASIVADAPVVSAAAQDTRRPFSPSTASSTKREAT